MFCGWELFAQEGRNMFKSVGTDNFSSEVLREQMPVLLARIRRDYGYKAQARILEGISKAYVKRLKVCILEENSIGTFKKYGIDGSPAFVIFHRGDEKGRILGKADKNTLNHFVSGILASLPGNQEAVKDLVADGEDALRDISLSGSHPQSTT